jgi:hypothetical protein
VNVPANATKEVIALGRGRCPNRLEVGHWAPAEFHVCIYSPTVRVGMKMKEGLVSQMEIWAVTVATGDVHELVDCAERFD